MRVVNGKMENIEKRRAKSDSKRKEMEKIF